MARSIYYAKLNFSFFFAHACGLIIEPFLYVRYDVADLTVELTFKSREHTITTLYLFVGQIQIVVILALMKIRAYGSKALQ